MSLESTMLCLDVSEFMRNGDYPPARIDAQQDAATSLIMGKLGRNAESTVGVLTHGGKSVRLLSSPTEDEGKLLACLHGLKPEHSPSFIQGVKTAMLALKHRKNRNGGQRIIIFSGSPVDASVDELKKLGALMKKNGIAVDIISMGENEGNSDKLEAFVEAVAKKDEGGASNSVFLTVPAGIMPSDMITSSPIYLGHDGGMGGGAGAASSGVAAGGGAGGARDFSEFGGIDPALDPELAMVMRASLEEARAAQGRAGSETGVAAAGTVGAGPAAETVPPQVPAMDEEEAALAAALAMSMLEGEAGAGRAGASAGAPAATPGPTAGSGLPASAFVTPAGVGSVQPTPVVPGAPAGAGQGAVPTSAVAPGGFSDPSFALELLGGLPGVDMNDPAVQEALRLLQGDGSGKGEEGKGDGK